MEVDHDDGNHKNHAEQQNQADEEADPIGAEGKVNIE